MDYINIKTFQILRGRNILDYTDWIEYNSIIDGKAVNRVLPNCDRKYYKYLNGEIKEMTANQKQTVDDNEALIIFNNRSKQQIFKEIREDFTASNEKVFIIKLLNKYSSFSDAVSDRDYDIARDIIDLAYSESDCTFEQATKIKGFLP